MRTFWFIFYDDQLLLRHDATGGRIPEGPVAPAGRPAGDRPLD